MAVVVEPEVPIRLFKYAAYQTSRSVDAAELVERCQRTLDRVVGAGFESLVTAQRSNLDRFWERADVTLEDTERHPVRMQQAVRWNLFHLAQATWRAEGAGIPAKGLTGDAYDGHYFWDTETWVLPFLAYTQPRIARNLLRFRHSMLRQGAASRPSAGSAWCTVPVAHDRRRRGVGLSPRRHRPVPPQCRHRLCHPPLRRRPRRTDFLVETGAEILVETARMWMDLGFFGDDGCFHIHGVTGPDEYTAMVDDNAYTNLMARLNLHYAAAVVRRLRVEQPEEFAGIAGGADARPVRTGRLGSSRRSHVRPTMMPAGGSPRKTPRSSPTNGGTSTDVPATKFPLLLHHHPLTMYRRQVLKQADVVMATFLLGNEFTAEQKRRNFEYYDPITTGDSSLSASIQSIVASEIGEEDAACEYLDHAAAGGPRRRGRQRLRRCAHRLRSRQLDGARIRIRRGPRLRRATHLRPSAASAVPLARLLVALPRPPTARPADPRRGDRTRSTRANRSRSSSAANLTSSAPTIL